MIFCNCLCQGIFDELIQGYVVPRRFQCQSAMELAWDTDVEAALELLIGIFMKFFAGI